MYPVLFQFNIFGVSFPIASYGLMMNVSAIISMILAIVNGKKLGYSADSVFYNGLLIICGGILGAVTVGFILFLPERFQSGFLSFPPVLISWGGIIGGCFTLYLIHRFWDIDFFDYCDFLTPSYLIAIGVGRIGCLLAGCCYGIHYTGFIALTFDHPLAPASAMNQPLFPAQLVSFLFLSISAFVFTLLLKKRKTKGALFFASLIVYGLFRFCIEFLRDDLRVFAGIFSEAQIFSFVIIIIGMTGLLNRKNSLPKVKN